MNIGSFDRQIVIETFTTVKDAAGQAIKTWAAAGTFWAKVEETGGGEDFEPKELVGLNKKKFYIRTCTDTNIDVTMRILYNTDYYNIRHIAEMGRKQYAVISAEKRDNQ